MQMFHKLVSFVVRASVSSDPSASDASAIPCFIVVVFQSSAHSRSLSINWLRHFYQYFYWNRPEFRDHAKFNFSYFAQEYEWSFWDQKFFTFLTFCIFEHGRLVEKCWRDLIFLSPFFPFISLVSFYFSTQTLWYSVGWTINCLAVDKKGGNCAYYHHTSIPLNSNLYNNKKIYCLDRKNVKKMCMHHVSKSFCKISTQFAIIWFNSKFFYLFHSGVLLYFFLVPCSMNEAVNITLRTYTQ